MVDSVSKHKQIVCVVAKYRTAIFGDPHQILDVDTKLAG